LEHELHKLHECRLPSVIPAEAGIHFEKTTYLGMRVKITARIHDFYR
jgi:hypothetical protein